MKISSPQICRGTGRALLLAGTIAAAMFRTQTEAAAPVVAPLGAYSQALQAPSRLAADASGNLYVVEPRDGRIVVFDAFGRISSFRTGFSGPLGIAVDGAGRIYLAEQGTGSVSVFDAQWNLLYRLGAGSGEFAMPNYVALDPSRPGMVYVTDSSANLVKGYQDGVLVLSFGGEGANALSFPAGVCVTSAGELFVVDQNNDRVQVYSTNGLYLRQFTLVTKVGSGMLGSYAGGRSQAVISDALGRIYVADSYQGFIRVFDPLGAYLGKVGAFGEAVGQLRTPAGLALDPFNRLFVASLNNGRVEIFGLDAYFHFKATPAASSVAEGTSVTLSVTAGGSGPFTWQWLKGGVNLADGGNISGAASPTLTLTGLASGDTGSYAVAVNGTVVSPGAILTVLLPPVITQGPADLTLVAGSDAVFSVVADGALPLAYQWQKDGRVLDGETSATHTVLQAQDFNAGVYAVVVSNLVGTATASATLTVLDPPTIMSAPLSLVVATGSDATFSVEATGTVPLTFQWQKDGADLPGATGSTLVLPSVQDSSAGTYAVVVANAGGTVTATATLTVMMPPVITQPPTNRTVVIGSNASFYVVADGSPRLRYQWQKDGSDLVAQNGTVLNLYQVQDADGGSYSVTVFNDVGRATAAALLTITHPPVVTDFSANTTVNATLLITTAQLLANASSPDQSPLRVSAASSPSTQGGTVILWADTVAYTPRKGFLGTDSFGYTVTDANGNSASARVLVTVTVPAPRMRNVTLITQGARLSFEGIPGQTYSLERMDGWGVLGWSRVGQATVGADGVGTFLDPTNLNPGASYRAVYP